MRNSIRRSSGTPALRSTMRVLDLDRAAHGVDDAAKLDDRPVAGALDHAAVVDGDGRIDEIAAQRAQPRQRAILVRAGQAAEADDVRGQDRREFASFRHASVKFQKRQSQQSLADHAMLSIYPSPEQTRSREGQRPQAAPVSAERARCSTRRNGARAQRERDEPSFCLKTLCAAKWWLPDDVLML